MPRQVYERDTDALFLRLLRAEPEFSGMFAELVLGFRPAGVPEIFGQRRHLGSTGSIDLVLRWRDGPLLLVENKIDAAYSITRTGHGQPQRYRETVVAYRAQGVEATSVLLAPSVYIAASRSAGMFDVRLTYESLLEAMGGADQALLEAAIRQGATPYEPVADAGASSFFAGIRTLISGRYLDLVMKH